MCVQVHISREIQTVLKHMKLCIFINGFIGSIDVVIYVPVGNCRFIQKTLRETLWNCGGVPSRYNYPKNIVMQFFGLNISQLIVCYLLHGIAMFCVTVYMCICVYVYMCIPTGGYLFNDKGLNHRVIFIIYDLIYTLQHLNLQSLLYGTSRFNYVAFELEYQLYSYHLLPSLFVHSAYTIIFHINM